MTVTVPSLALDLQEPPRISFEDECSLGRMRKHSMIIARSALRIPLGGSTDILSDYRRPAGCVISVAFGRCVKITPLGMEGRDARLAAHS